MVSSTNATAVNFVSDMYDINKVRVDFPILSREVYGKPLVYLDNAATTQKPLMVLDAMRDEYLNVNANVHRGVHYLSQQATDLHEAAREKVRAFINARKTEEIVFTRGTTEAINLVASSFCESQMQAGDEVLVTEMEHHSNIVSWQLQAMKRGIVVKHIPITDDGLLCLDQLEGLITEKTKIISVAHVSRLMFRPWIAISSPSVVIRCMDLRALAYSMAKKSGSRNCLRIRVGER